MADENHLKYNFQDHWEKKPLALYKVTIIAEQDPKLAGTLSVDKLLDQTNVEESLLEEEIEEQYEFVPLSHTAVYIAYLKTVAQKFRCLKNGYYFEILGCMLEYSDWLNENVITIIELQEQHKNCNILAPDTPTAKEQTLNMENPAYFYHYNRHSYLDYIDHGITLMDKIKWLLYKFRTRYAMQVYYLIRNCQFNQMMPLTFYAMSLSSNTLKLDLSLYDLFKLNLLPIQWFPELLELVPKTFDDSYLHTWFEETFNVWIFKDNIEDIIHRKYWYYIDLLNTGACFLHNWSPTINTLWNMINRENCVISKFPYNWIDMLSGGLMIKDKTRTRQENIELEKLIIFITNIKSRNIVNRVMNLYVNADRIMFNEPNEKNVLIVNPAKNKFKYKLNHIARTNTVTVTKLEI